MMMKIEVDLEKLSFSGFYSLMKKENIGIVFVDLIVLVGFPCIERMRNTLEIKMSDHKIIFIICNNKRNMRIYIIEEVK